MPSIQNGVEFLASICQPFAHSIFYNWGMWGSGQNVGVFDQKIEDARDTWNRFREKRTLSVRARDRPWEECLQKLFYLSDSFYAIKIETLGTYYEQYLRALLGVYKFAKKFPQFYEDYVPDIVQDNVDILGELRNRMLDVWNFSTRVSQRQAVIEALETHGTYPDLANYFLENAPIMQDTYNAREGKGNFDEVLKKVDIARHYDGNYLLAYLLRLQENVVRQNFAKAQGIKNFTGENHGFILTTQNAEQSAWKTAYPDSADPAPMILEWSLDPKELLPMGKTIQVRAEDFHAGYGILRRDFEEETNTYKKIRQQLVQLLIMDNTYPNVSEDFWSYYTQQKRNLNEFRSFYDRRAVQALIFSEGFTEQNMETANWTMFGVLCDNAERQQMGIPQVAVQPQAVPLAGPPGITVDSPYVIPAAIIAVLLFVWYKQS